MNTRYVLSLFVLLFLGLTGQQASMAQPLSGTYTIGGVTPDYPDFTTAAAALDTHGVSGAVVFNVAPGMYNEQLVLPVIVGTSASNTITFNCTGATIHFAPTVSDARHIVRLQGADYVTFRGLVITVDSGATYGWGIQLSDTADNNSFVSCTINGDTVSTSSVNFAGIVATGSNTSPATAGGNANNLTIDSCTVIGGYYGIRLNGSSTTSGTNNVIKNSIIQDTYVYNIYLQYQADALVSANEIMRPNRTGVSTFYGVYFTSSAQNCTVEKNRVHNTHGSATSLTGSAYGVYFSSADAPTGMENVVKNNIFYDFNGDGLIYMLYNSGSDGAYYYNNTISLDHAAATAGATRGFYQTTAASNIDFRNNIITITRGGSGDKHGLYFATSTSSIISDNNAIYINSLGSGSQYFGNFGGTNYATYNDWRTANGGIYDSLSVNGDPVYTDLGAGNLKPSSGLVNGIGVTLAEVTEDILGNPRGVPPDPGAYEFDPAATDVAVTEILGIPAYAGSGSTINFDVIVSNLGDPIAGATLDIKLNGVVESTLPVSALGSGASDTLDASVTASNLPGTDVVTAVLRPVPGDPIRANDSLQASYVVVGGDTTYRVSYHVDAGNPGGLNAEADATTTDWTILVSGPQSTNIWSPAMEIPFPFEFFGTTVTHFKASQNLVLTFDTSVVNVPGENTNLPSDSLPNMSVAAMWDAFTGAPPTGTNDHIYTKTFGNAPNRQLWIKWYSFEYGNPNVAFHYCSIVLEETTNKIYVVDQYSSTSPALSTTVGLQLDNSTATAFGGNAIPQSGNGSALPDNDYWEFFSPFQDIAAVNISDATKLTMMPLSQTTLTSSIAYSGTYRNFGPSNTGNVSLSVRNSQGTQVFSDAFNGVTLGEISDSTFDFSAWNASSATPDLYTATTFASGFADTVRSNDTTSATLLLGKRMAYDNGNFTNSIAHSSALNNRIGARFTLTDADTLTSVTMQITSSVIVTDSFAIDIYTSVNDTPTTAVARIYRGTFGDFSPLPALVTFAISGGMPMPAGDFYAILDMDTPTSASFPIGADNTGPGARAIPRRFAATSGTSAWLFFEDAGNAVFHTLTPIVRVGFREPIEVPPPAKLLITEFVVTPTAGEFIEIYNPGTETVDLTNYYLTDATFAGDGSYYYNIVRDTLYGGGSFGDFHARFPAGAQIPPATYQTVALNGNSDFFGTYSVNPTYEIDQPEFASGTNDSIPNMLEVHPGSIYGPDSTHNPGLTNGDEVIVLYYWNGTSDLVGDVDYVLYNSASPTPNDEAVDKSGVMIDGPDPDTLSSAYLNDTPIANQVSAPSHSTSGVSVHRIDLTEGAQIMSGGNGVTGANEMSEDLNITFTNNSLPSPNAAYQPILSVGDGNDGIPATYELGQNYPNPFNPSTIIRFGLPTQSSVTLRIYNILGQEMITLLNETKPAGYYDVQWNGRNRLGAQLASGIYFYRLEASAANGKDSYVNLKKMLLVK